MKITIAQLADIAMQMESNHDIDWENMPASKENAYMLMAGHAIEILAKTKKEEIMAATITHLLVENFMLNLQLNG